MSGTKDDIDAIVAFFDALGSVMGRSQPTVEKFVLGVNEQYVVECQHVRSNRPDGPNLAPERIAMSADQQRQFPGWDALYQQQAIETMPWFYPELDDDLRHALDRLGLQSGAALDLGTGPGTQAMQLARRGIAVTAVDISEAAIQHARENAEAQGLTVTWQQGDVLATRLSGTYELIFDRGCFHVLPPERRPDYVRTIAELLTPGGYFFLKCFSRLQPGAQGPHRFAPEQIREIFGSQLQVQSIVGLNMKGASASARLIEMPSGGMCQYKVNLTDAAEVDTELLAWIKQAYESAG